MPWDWTITFEDRTDFDDGKWFGPPGVMEIADEVINQCNEKYWKTGKDFDIEDEDSGSWLVDGNWTCSMSPPHPN